MQKLISAMVALGLVFASSHSVGAAASPRRRVRSSSPTWQSTSADGRFADRSRSGGAEARGSGRRHARERS